MPSITLAYGPGGATPGTFNGALSVKGFLPTDGHIGFPDLRPVFLNGSIRKKQANFRRVFKIDLNILTTAADLEFIGLFLNNEDQFIDSYSYAGIGGTINENDIRVVDRHLTYEAVWEGGIEAGRHVFLELEEADPRVGWPSEQGYGYAYGTDYGDHL